MTSYAKELEVASEAVLDAGRYLNEVFGKIRRGELTAQDLALMSKGSHKDYSTGPDRESERRITERLTDYFAGMPLLAEENRSDVRFPHGEGIAVDPLDGTRRFHHGIEEYSVAIQRFKDGEVVWAVVYAPSATNTAHPNYPGELFEGIRGEGVMLNGKPLVMLGPDEDLSQSLILTGYNYQTDLEYFKRDLAGLAPVIQASKDVSRGGSGAYDTCKVAAGRYGTYFERSWGDPWSLAGALMFVEQMGGVTSDYKGRPIDLFRRVFDDGSKKWRFNAQWVASKNEKIHKEVLRLLGELEG